MNDKELIRALLFHLDYVGWGDSWERECSEELRAKAKAWTEANPQTPPEPEPEHTQEGVK